MAAGAPMTILGYGKLTRSLTVLPELTAAPVVLMTWLIVPVPPSDTVSRSWNLTVALLGTSKECPSTTLGLVLKKQ